MIKVSKNIYNKYQYSQKAIINRTKYILKIMKVLKWENKFLHFLGLPEVPTYPTIWGSSPRSSFG